MNIEDAQLGHFDTISDFSFSVMYPLLLMGVSSESKNCD